jgi:hypothetical protein
MAAFLRSVFFAAMARSLYFVNARVGGRAMLQRGIEPANIRPAAPQQGIQDVRRVRVSREA